MGIICRAWTGTQGSCSFGDRCHFLHGDKLSSDVSSIKSSPGELAKIPEHRGSVTTGKHLNPLAAEFVPTAASHSSIDIDQYQPSGFPLNDVGPVPLFVPSQLHETSNAGSQQSHVSVPVPREFAYALCNAISRIQSNCGGVIYYDSLSEAAVVTGTAAEQKSACTEITAVVEEATRRHSAECCVCLEAPGSRETSDGRPGRYGLLEGCDHIVCMGCIMKWRQNEGMTRDARLGCPVCRSISHIIVPWPEAVGGDEKLAILTQHKERCRATPCKWSTQGRRCPAGRHCIYDHSSAPQVIDWNRYHRMELGFSDERSLEALMSRVQEEMIPIMEELVAYTNRQRGRSTGDWDPLPSDLDGSDSEPALSVD